MLHAAVASRENEDIGVGFARLGTCHLLDNLLAMLTGDGKVELERELYVANEVLKSFRLALEYKKKFDLVASLMLTQRELASEKALAEFKRLLGRDVREKFLQPLVNALEAFIENVALYAPRPLTLPLELREGIIHDLRQLVQYARFSGGFYLPRA